MAGVPSSFGQPGEVGRGDGGRRSQRPGAARFGGKFPVHLVDVRTVNGLPFQQRPGVGHTAGHHALRFRRNGRRR